MPCTRAGYVAISQSSPRVQTQNSHLCVGIPVCPEKKLPEARGQLPQPPAPTLLPLTPRKNGDRFRIISRDASSSPQRCLKLVIPSAFTTTSRHTGQWVQGRVATVLVGQNGSHSTASSCKYIMQRELETLEPSKGSKIAHSPWMPE